METEASQVDESVCRFAFVSSLWFARHKIRTFSLRIRKFTRSWRHDVCIEKASKSSLKIGSNLTWLKRLTRAEINAIDA